MDDGQTKGGGHSFVTIHVSIDARVTNLEIC